MKEHTDGLVSECIALLSEFQARRPEVHVLPGSMELPLAAQTIAGRRQTDAIICFGAVVKGETMHFEVVVNETVRGLGEVSRAMEIPIFMEIIPALRIEDVIERCRPGEFNKGREAAAAAIHFLNWRDGLRADGPTQSR